MESTQVSLVCPTDQKYIMFLPERYYKSTFFENIYKKLRKNLENLGITLFCIDDFINQFNQKKTNLLFDDKCFPITNQLYVHMFENLYYSDSIYNKKKIEKEREHLFLLAGKLGAHTIEYKTEICETSITQASAGASVNNLAGSISYTKKIEKKQGIEGREIYENRGASDYVESKNKDELDTAIKKSFENSKFFSYDFYQKNQNLQSFVFKRCKFKMSYVEYIIESEDILDLSLSVKALFIEYGLAISFEKNTIYSENIKYELKFYPDDVLIEECARINYEYERAKSDPFYAIKKCYDNWKNENDKKSILYEIYDYVFNMCKYAYGKIVDEENNNKIYYFSLDRIIRFILQTIPDVKDEWEEFTHTSEIKIWIEEFLYENLFDKLNDNKTELQKIDNNKNQDESEDGLLQEDESFNKIIKEIQNQYKNIKTEKINNTVTWFNIDWGNDEDNIKSVIKKELNNNCTHIELNKNTFDFTVILGDKSIYKTQKVDNVYIKTKRNFNPTSRMARVQVDNNINYYRSRIDELEKEKENVDDECNKLKEKINGLESKNNELESNNEKLQFINNQQEFFYNELKDNYDKLQNQYTEILNTNNILGSKYNEIKIKSANEIELLNKKIILLEEQLSDKLNKVDEIDDENDNLDLTSNKSVGKLDKLVKKTKKHTENKKNKKPNDIDV